MRKQSPANHGKLVVKSNRSSAFSSVPKPRWLKAVMLSVVIGPAFVTSALSQTAKPAANEGPFAVHS